MGPSRGTVKLHEGLLTALVAVTMSSLVLLMLYLVPQPDEDEDQADGDGDQARVQEDVPAAPRHLPPVWAILCNVSC